MHKQNSGKLEKELPWSNGLPIYSESLSFLIPIQELSSIRFRNYSSQNMANSSVEMKLLNEIPENMESSYSNTNPFLVDLIVDNLVKYIGAMDDDTKKKCRLVCTFWSKKFSPLLQFKLSRSEEVISYLESFSGNCIYPFIHHLELHGDDIFNFNRTLELLTEIGPTLRVLKITSTNLSYYPFIFLPALCPNLRELTIDVLHIRIREDMFIPPPLSDIWNNDPFPFLETINFGRGLYLDFSCVLLKLLFSKMKRVNNLSLHLMTSCEIQYLAKFIINTPRVLSNGLNQLEINRADCNCFMEILSTTSYYWKHLTKLTIVQRSLINQLSESTLGTFLPNVFRATSKHLKQLTVVNSRREGDLGYVTFPCPMESLQSLCLGDVGLREFTKNGNGDGKGVVGMSTLFPKLRLFQLWFYSHVQDECENNIASVLFPKSLIEKETMDYQEEDQDIDKLELKSLSQFHMYTRIINVEFIKEIQLVLPNLRKLLLEIDGSVLEKVIEIFKNSSIEEFLVRYIARNSGTMADFETVSGMSKEDYKMLRNDELKFMNSDLSRFKTKASLADWKYLRSLSISYHAYDKDQGVIDWIFVKEFVLKSKALEHLELRHFIIHEKLIVKLLKESQLKSLNISDSEVELFDGLRYQPYNQMEFKEIIEKRIDNEVGARLKCLITDEYHPLYSKTLNYFEIPSKKNMRHFGTSKH